MEFRKDLGFARITRNQRIDNELMNVFKRAYSLNKKIFRKGIKEFRIFVCDTEKDIRKKSKNFYQKWGTAYVINNRDLITRSPDFVERVGMWKREDFQNLMNHEMNHVFYQSIYGSHKPVWLMEGLACYVGKNFILQKNELKKLILKHDVDSAILDHRYLRRKFRQGHFPRYPVWAGFTKHIIKKHSFAKLISFLDRYAKKPNNQNYHRLFKEIFGISERRMFNEFSESVKA